MNENYKILGVTEKDSKETIRNKYINLLRKYHPDRHGNKYLDKCQKINYAYKKILEEKENPKHFVPKGFQNLGFRKIPTVDEYIRKILKSCIDDKEEGVEGE